MSDLVERRPAAAKQAAPEPPGWWVAMTYGDLSPCDYFVRLVLWDAFRLSDDLAELAIKTALAGQRAPIRTCGSRDIAETLARRGNEAVAAVRRRSCQQNCVIEFTAEPTR